MPVTRVGSRIPRKPSAKPQIDGAGVRHEVVLEACAAALQLGENAATFSKSIDRNPASAR